MAAESLANYVVNKCEEIASVACDNLYKYRDTADEDCVCDYMREGSMKYAFYLRRISKDVRSKI